MSKIRFLDFFKTRDNTRTRLNKMAVTAVFVALACALKLVLFFQVSLFGENGMQIGFSGIFTTFPALLFGPIYGGISSALFDVLGFMLRPTGSYGIEFTLTAFLAGFIKGCIWWLIVKKLKNRTPNLKAKRLIRLITALVLTVIAVLGLCININLNESGMISGLLAKKEDIYYKEEIEQVEKNFISQQVVQLAQYENNRYILTNIRTTSEEVVIPSKIIANDKEISIYSIGANAFENAKNVKKIYITKNTTTIDKNAFTGLEDFTIVTVKEPTSDTAAFTFAKDNKINYEFVDDIDIIKIEAEYGYDPTTLKISDLVDVTVINNDNYRIKLALYINMITLGLIVFAALGFLIIITELAISFYNSKKKSGQKNYFFAIFTSVTIAGVIVTTINTVIMVAYFVAAWKGRSFIVYYIPRLVEEIIICGIQSYFISVLYSAYLYNIKDKIKTFSKI